MPTDRDDSQYLIVERKVPSVISVPVIRDGEPADYRAAEAIQMAAFGSVHWTFGDEPFKVAETIGGETIAYLVWRQTFTDEYEILSIATHPGHRRKGVARALIDDFRSAHKGDVFLEVRESNAAAIALYEHAGFVKAGVRHAYYSSDDEAAVVMKLHSRL